MDFGKSAHLCTIVLSLFAVYMGIKNRQADILMPGVLSALLSATMLLMSLKGKSITIMLSLILDLFLIISVIATIFNITDFARMAMVTPLFVSVGACMVLCLIAYTEVKLDRAMFYVYFLFSTLAVSNVFSYGVYYYYLVDGVADEMQSNFWLVDGFAFALTFCILAMFIARAYMRKKDIRLIQACEILEGCCVKTE
ncbi:MAG: hypothetical protein LBR42_05105 [Candidatus Methanoplasma sp.]|jgi:hypothetical protein|nr:hypothetical protein [Candidatus Methanoplasma sp.]